MCILQLPRCFVCWLVLVLYLFVAIGALQPSSKVGTVSNPNHSVPGKPTRDGVPVLSALLESVEDE